MASALPFSTGWSWSQLILIALIISGLITIGAAGSRDSDAFSSYNPEWDGSSSVSAVGASSDVPVDLATDTMAYTRAQPDTIALAIAPSDQYTDEDLARIRSFVRRGGTLVIAEDVGAGGNQILSGVGADTRFDGRIVRDLRHNGPTAEMPVATEVSTDPLTRDVDSLMLNNGTVLVATNETGVLTPVGSPNSTANATVLVSTSSYSYIDGDHDGEFDDDPLQSYPVVAVEQVGNGRVVAVSDASIFINSMQDRASNRAFLTAVVEDHEQVLLDYSYAGQQPPVRVALSWLRQTPIALAGIGVLSLLGLELLVRRKVLAPTEQ